MTGGVIGPEIEVGGIFRTRLLVTLQGAEGVGQAQMGLGRSRRPLQGLPVIGLERLRAALDAAVDFRTPQVRPGVGRCLEGPSVKDRLGSTEPERPEVDPRQCLVDLRVGPVTGGDRLEQRRLGPLITTLAGIDERPSNRRLGWPSPDARARRELSRNTLA